MFEQVVLICDHQQLGSVLVNQNAARAGLTQSLFEHLAVFHDGTLQNGQCHCSRASSQECQFPVAHPGHPNVLSNFENIVTKFFKSGVILYLYKDIEVDSVDALISISNVPCFLYASVYRRLVNTL
ncbi:hypothetical protein EDB19DRAFT_1727817, partial [Suillus lakei]